MRTIELTKVPRNNPVSVDAFDPAMDSDDVGENLGREATPAPVEADTKVTIAVDSIRCFYPRRDNRPGTRLTFKDGGGFPVTETYEEVKALIASDL